MVLSNNIRDKNFFPIFLMSDWKWVWKHWFGLWSCWQKLYQMGSRHGSIFGYWSALGHVPAIRCSWSHCELFVHLFLLLGILNDAFYALYVTPIFNYLQINTCNGFYCDQFTPNSNNKPKMWTENWSGWYGVWLVDSNDFVYGWAAPSARLAIYLLHEISH